MTSGKQELGFVGVGRMGIHMAGRLLEAGYGVTVCDLALVSSSDLTCSATAPNRAGKTVTITATATDRAGNVSLPTSVSISTVR